MVQSGDREPGRRKKFLNNFSSDPFISTPAEAQAKLREDDKNWGEYMKIAKIEPQG